MTTTTRRTLPALAFTLLLAACGGSQTFRADGSQAAPGALARIEVGKTEGAQMVDVDLQHLAPPQRIAPGATRYAVWVLPDTSPPVLAGFLTYDEDSRRGRLRATTPHERFQIVVSAESDVVGSTPSQVVVIRRGVP